MLCLTSNIPLCVNPETDEFDNKVLPEYVVAPLSYSGPLSMPSALPQYEVTPGVLSLSKRSCNEVLPENVVEPLSYSGPLSMPSALSQYEATPGVHSLNERSCSEVLPENVQIFCGLLGFLPQFSGLFHIYLFVTSRSLISLAIYGHFQVEKTGFSESHHPA